MGISHWLPCNQCKRSFPQKWIAYCIALHCIANLLSKPSNPQSLCANSTIPGSGILHQERFENEGMPQHRQAGQVPCRHLLAITKEPAFPQPCLLILKQATREKNCNLHLVMNQICEAHPCFTFGCRRFWINYFSLNKKSKCSDNSHSSIQPEKNC